MASNRYLDQLDAWPATQPIPADALLLLAVPALGKEFRLDAARIAAGSAAGNAARGTTKYVVGLTRTAGNASYDTLDTLDPDTFCLGGLANVEAGADGRFEQYRCVFDAAAEAADPLAEKCWLDGTFQGRRVGFTWQLVGAAVPAGIAAYDPAEYNVPFGPTGQRVYDERIWQPRTGPLSGTAQSPIPAPSDSEGAPGTLAWKEVSSAPKTVLFQRVGRPLALSFIAEQELVQARQYEIVRDGGNIITQTLGDTGDLLNPFAIWLNPATGGKPERVTYNLATDEVLPEPTGPGDGLGDLTVWADNTAFTAGRYYVDNQGVYVATASGVNDGATLEEQGNFALVYSFGGLTPAQAVAAVTASGLFQKNAGERVVRVSTTGTRTSYANFTTAVASTQPGDTVEIYGVHDLGGGNFAPTSGGAMWLAPGSEVIFGDMFSPSADYHISGPGTLRGRIYASPGCPLFTITGSRIRGQINPYSFPDTLPARQLIVTGCDHDSGAAIPVLVSYANGGFYATYCRVTLLNNRIKTTNAEAVVKFLDAANGAGGTPNPAAAKAANLLQMAGNIITAPAGTKALFDTYDDFAFEEGINYYVGGVLPPAKVSENTIVISPTVGGDGDTNPYTLPIATANQRGGIRPGTGVTMNGDVLSVDGVGASPRVVYTSQSDAVSDAVLNLANPAFGTDSTAALQDLLDLALTGPLLVFWDGAYSVSGLTIHSDTRILALEGCGAILRNGSERPLLMNRNLRIGNSSTWQDRHMAVVGGVWHGNRDGQATKANSTFGLIGCFSFHGVKGLEVRGAKMLASRVYAINAMGVEDAYFLQNIIDVGTVSGVTNSDGIHIGGNSNNVVVSDLWANCGDDSIVCTADDNYQAGAFGQVSGGPSNPLAGLYDNAGGPITNVVIDNVQASAQLGVVRLLSAGSRMDNILIRNVRGQTSKYWLCIDNFQYLDPATMNAAGGGNFGKIVVEECSVRVVPYAGIGFYLRRARAMVSANIEELHIRGLSRTDFEEENHCDLLLYGKQGGTDYFGYPTNVVGGGATPVIQKLVFSNYTGRQTNGTASATPVIWNDGVDVRLLEMHNCSTTSTVASGEKPLYFQTAGNVEDLQISGVQLRGIPKGFHFAGGTVGFGISAVGVLHKGTSDYTFASVGVTIPEIVASNFRGNRGKIVSSDTLFALRSGDAFQVSAGGGTGPPTGEPAGQVELIENNNPSLSKSGQWAAFSSAGASGGTVDYSIGNSTASITYTVPANVFSVEVGYVQGGSGADFDVLLDGELVASGTCKGGPPEGVSGTLYTSAIALSPGVAHELKYRIRNFTGAENLFFDCFRLTR